MAPENTKKIPAENPPDPTPAPRDEVDPVEVTKKADQLLGERPRGDEHFPGEVNLDRISLVRDLPRRT